MAGLRGTRDNFYISSPLLCCCCRCCTSQLVSIFRSCPIGCIHRPWRVYSRQSDVVLWKVRHFCVGNLCVCCSDLFYLRCFLFVMFAPPLPCGGSPYQLRCQACYCFRNILLPKGPRKFSNRLRNSESNWFERASLAPCVEVVRNPWGYNSLFCEAIPWLS